MLPFDPYNKQQQSGGLWVKLNDQEGNMQPVPTKLFIFLQGSWILKIVLCFHVQVKGSISTKLKMLPVLHQGTRPKAIQNVSISCNIDHNTYLH